VTSALVKPTWGTLCPQKWVNSNPWVPADCWSLGPVAHRLVHDGEMIFDVPAKLSVQVRVFATGNGRKPTGQRALVAVAHAPRRSPTSDSAMTKPRCDDVTA
jgi:transposase